MVFGLDGQNKMITPSFGLTATERVLPRLALDFTTASLDPRVTFTRTANTATVINSIGDVAPINADLPRFDFNPITLACRGLLIEEARTNLLAYSEQFNNAVWSKLQCSIVEDSITAPDGLLTADKIVEDTTSTAHQVVITSFSFTSGTSYTISVFAKTNGRDLRIGFGSAAFTTSQLVVFNLTTGTASINSGTPTFTIAPYKDGWYRCTVTATATATAATSIVFTMLSGTIAGYLGNGTSGVYLWGAQLEAGAFPTSYIPTEATAITRNADVATMTGTNFTDWFNASEGTFFAQTLTPVGASGAINRLLSANDGSTSNRIEIDTGTNPNTTILRINASGVNQGTVTVDGVADFQTRRSVFAYKQDAFAMAVNGGAVGEDTSANVPTVDRLLIGASFATGSSYANGLIQKVMYWPYRLTNAEIQAFSK
jgi:hypothetical protein